ncbi:hypothetical protein SDJN02_18382, partial [Cucurbita argyrosperma subsp. argyrosperma]
MESSEEEDDFPSIESIIPQSKVDSLYQSHTEQSDAGATLKLSQRAHYVPCMQRQCWLHGICCDRVEAVSEDTLRSIQTTMSNQHMSCNSPILGQAKFIDSSLDQLAMITKMEKAEEEFLLLAALHKEKCGVFLKRSPLSYFTVDDSQLVSPTARDRRSLPRGIVISLTRGLADFCARAFSVTPCDKTLCLHTSHSLTSERLLFSIPALMLGLPGPGWLFRTTTKLGKLNHILSMAAFHFVG